MYFQRASIDLHDFLKDNIHSENKFVICNEKINFFLEEKFLLMKNITQGVIDIHKKNFVHRDLSTSNILIFFNQTNKKITPKINDFEYLIKVKDKEEYDYSHHETLFIAFELKQDISFSTRFSCDIFALGTIFFLITCPSYTSYTKFDESDFIKVKENLKNISEEYMELILSCWNTDRKYRPQAEEIIFFLEILISLQNKEGNNYSKARYKLGVCFYKGEIVPLNYSKAFECFEEVKDEVKEAKKLLGLMYLQGFSVSKNYEKAKELFNELISNGDHI